MFSILSSSWVDTKTKKHEENVIGKFKVLPISECIFSHGPVPHCRIPEQWGDWEKGTNYFPITFTLFYKIVTAGDYSYEGNAVLITDVSKLNCFVASKAYNRITQYVAIGK